MKIHYISAHSILEYDEVQLLTELGHEVFSNGAYIDPAGHFSLPRPSISGAAYYPEFAELARITPKTDLPSGLIDPFDVIIVMHTPEVIVQNWHKFKGKVVIWRSIGQSTPGVERMLAPFMAEGLKIIRYSPKEENIDGYIGGDVLIRFYKDPEVYNGWVGQNETVINFSQSLLGRRGFCHYDDIFPVIKKFKGKVYGSGNDDLGEFNGGEVPYKMQNQLFRNTRVVLYGGTWPASYTLSFMEALMTGTPIVAISKKLAHLPQFEPIDFYEVDEILAEAEGVVCDSVEDMIEQTEILLNNYEHAKNVSTKQRQIALKYFGKENIAAQWRDFLKQFEVEEQE